MKLPNTSMKKNSKNSLLNKNKCNVLICIISFVNKFQEGNQNLDLKMHRLIKGSLKGLYLIHFRIPTRSHQTWKCLKTITTHKLTWEALIILQFSLYRRLATIGKRVLLPGQSTSSEHTVRIQTSIRPNGNRRNKDSKTKFAKWKQVALNS